MGNHTCLLDFHQRSHYVTITIGPEEKFNRILQLINSQKVRLFDSFVEEFNAQRSPKPTQPIPKPIRDRSGQPEDTLSVIEARNLSENTRVEQIHDRSGQPDECNSLSAHTVKEQTCS